jgi:hypothetical protein
MLYCVCAWDKYDNEGSTWGIKYTNLSYDECKKWYEFHRQRYSAYDYYEIVELPIGKENV